MLRIMWEYFIETYPCIEQARFGQRLDGGKWYAAPCADLEHTGLNSPMMHRPALLACNSVRVPTLLRFDQHQCRPLFSYRQLTTLKSLTNQCNASRHAVI